MTGNRSVIIVGGGIAGLAAASRLSRAGFSVVILEARDRIGGRIFTKRLPGDNQAIELGAEFIHGLPPEIWQPVQEHGLDAVEVEGEGWCVSDVGILPCRFFSDVDSLLSKMDDSIADESFLDFLSRRFPNPRHDPHEEAVKRRATQYVSGFNAADPALVGVHWLVDGMRAEEQIQGHRAFRLKGGYESLLEIFRGQIANRDVKVQANSVVTKIEWSKSRAAVTVQNADQNADRPASLAASQVLITVPVGVLKATVGEVGAIQFVPQLPRAKTDALDKIEMGHVIRVTLRFRDRFWDAIQPPPDKDKSLAEMGFLFSDDKFFPTWWTTMPEKAPMITGWAPFRSAELLSGQNNSFVVDHALGTLARLLGVRNSDGLPTSDLEGRLEGAYFHDWQNDPFSRGAYTYGKVGSDGAQQNLGAPIDNTLFFAGEATDTTGHNGTVHAAIASGYRAADEIVKARE
jgi:monoamine oxidase